MRSVSPLSVVRSSLVAVLAEGIPVEPGATFDWVHGTWPHQHVDGRPRAVNWMGAVLWTTRGDQRDFSYKRLREVLGIRDFTWFYRFSYGFNQGRALSVPDPETQLEVREEVSLAASRLAKEFCR